jgi:pimeloyl-ACP methyl ester carboxylesterase
LIRDENGVLIGRLGWLFRIARGIAMKTLQGWFAMFFGVRIQQQEPRMHIRRLFSACVFLAIPSALLGAEAAGEAAMKKFDSDGVEIAFYDKGRGEPVVVVHGFAGDAKFMEEFCSQLAKAGYRVIALDQRGHGESDKPHNADAYGVEFADDVVRLLDHLKLDKAHVVGYSMGGGVVNKLRERHPSRLWTVTLAGAGFSVVDWGLPGVNPKTMAAALRKGDGFRPLLRALGKTDPDFDTEAEVERWNETLMERNDPLALAAVQDAQPGLQVSIDSLKVNSVPTLIILGDKDGNRPGAEKMAAVMKESKFVLLEDKTHIQAVLQPTEIVAGIVQFLKEWRCTGGEAELGGQSF